MEKYRAIFWNGARSNGEASCSGFCSKFAKNGGMRHVDIGARAGNRKDAAVFSLHGGAGVGV